MKHIKLKLILLEVLKETENFELADLGDMSQKEIDDLNADRKKHDLPPYRKATSAEISLLNKGSRATEEFRNRKYFPAIKLIDGSIVRGTDHEDAIRNAKNSAEHYHKLNSKYQRGFVDKDNNWLTLLDIARREIEKGETK